MTKAEVIALGVPEDRLKEFQEVYNRDLWKAVKNQQGGSAKAIRTAIGSMLPLIHRTVALREILELTTRLYCAPDNFRPEDKE